jgi:hypothetical protein
MPKNDSNIQSQTASPFRCLRDVRRGTIEVENEFVASNVRRSVIPVLVVVRQMK